MTAARNKVEASLAERGRPALWANEAEAAFLSGFSPEAFRLKVKELEAAGFPQVSRWNGKRFIPAIVNFWACQVDSTVQPKPVLVEDEKDGQEVENFGAGQRRAS